MSEARKDLDEGLAKAGPDIDFYSDYGDAISDNELAHQKYLDEEFHDAEEIEVPLANKSSKTKLENICSETSVLEVTDLKDKCQQNKLAESGASQKSRAISVERRLRRPSVVLQNLSKMANEKAIIDIKVDSKEPENSSYETKNPLSSFRRSCSANNTANLSVSENPTEEIPPKSNIPMFKNKNPLPNKFSSNITQKLQSSKTPSSGEKSFGMKKSSITNDENLGRKSSNSSLNAIMRKKLKYVTLDKETKESKCELFGNETKPKSSERKEKIKPPSAKSREEEICALKEKIAISKMCLYAEKSCTSVNVNKGNSRQSPHRNLSQRMKSPKTTSPKKKSINKNLNSKGSALNLEDVKPKEEDQITSNEIEKIISPPTPESSKLNNTTHQEVGSVPDASNNTGQYQNDNEKNLNLVRKKSDESKINRLQEDNESLRDLISKQQMKESELRKEVSSISDTLLKTTQSLQNLEKKLTEKDSIISQLRCNITKFHGLSEKLKAKEDVISEIESKLSNAQENCSKLKKELENSLSDCKSSKKENTDLKRVICELNKEKIDLETQIRGASEKNSSVEVELTETLVALNEERRHRLVLENNQSLLQNDITDLKNKLQCASSSKLVSLSEHLLEKDTVISELESLREGVQKSFREVCGMLSSVLCEVGSPKSEDEIESLILSGRILNVKNSLLSSLEDGGRKESGTSHDECRKVIFNLEDRAAVLEAELEESKHYSDTLAGMISSGKAQWAVGEQGKQQPLVRPTEEKAIGDSQNAAYSPGQGGLPPASHYELYVLLEGKRQALMKMERKVQELEEVHANCSQKRVRNEMRIDQLEMALAQLNYN